MGEAMADRDMMHTAEIVKAALPFVDSKTKGMGELFVRVFELMGTLNSAKNVENLAACGSTASKIDMEGLLNGIRPVCNHKERDIIDRILNIFNMRRMMEMYNNMMEAMKTMQEFGGFPFGDSGSSADTDTVTGNFGGMNFDSIFNMMNQGSEEKKEPDIDVGQADNVNYQREAEENSGNQNGNWNPGSGSNDRMFEMLKTMIPPEKQGTFENLSMLLKTMSYDNNSKPEQKESNDG
jgi:hypothetical protein